MSLFYLSAKFPIYSLQSERQFGIQRILSKTYSISRIQTPNCSKVSNFAGVGLFNLNPSLQNTQCRCMSSSSGSNPSIEKSSISETEIFVKGLAKSTTERSLKTAFSKIGDVSKVKIILDKRTGQSLGFAYIWFSREEFAQKAIEEMNGEFFEGRFINVSIARPRAYKDRSKAKPLKF